MAYYDQYQDSFGVGDTPLTAFGGLEHSTTAANAFSNAIKGNTKAMFDVASGAMEGKAAWEEAKLRAKAFEDQQRAKSNRGFFGNLLGAVGTGVGFLNPIAGAGIKAAGGFFG